MIGKETAGENRAVAVAGVPPNSAVVEAFTGQDVGNGLLHP
jgi:hypothetical protein